MQRVVFLDGLRGFAALLVLFGHLLEVVNRTAESAVVEWVLAHVGFGRIGVMAFFCISGFVIPYSFKKGVRTFAVKRFLRLYPAFWLSVALAAVIFGGMSAATVAANLTMAPVLFGQPDAIGVYWTLFIELLFYGLCAVLCAAGVLRNPVVAIGMALTLWGVSILSALAAYLNAPIQPPPGIPGYLGVMFLGLVWRFAWLEGDETAKRAFPYLIAAAILTATFVGLFGFRSNLPGRPLADFLGVYAGLALFFAAFACRSWLEGRVAIWLGAISYSLYLLHPLAITVAEEIGAVALAVPLSLAMAHLSREYVEKPALRLKLQPLRSDPAQPR